MITRILGREFLIELAKVWPSNLNKKCFSKVLLSGNRLPEDVIDYQWPNTFYNSYKNLNSKILKAVIDYTILVIDYQQLVNVLIQNLKAVIDYTITVIDYQTGISEK